jgi:hypothetical protein
VLDSRRRLFAEEATPRSLKRVQTTTTSTGIVVAIYEPAGPLLTGSFELPEP